MTAGFKKALLTKFHSSVRVVAWTTLGLLGQVSALQMIDAGKRMHYQHYRPADAPVLVIIFFLIQSVLVLTAIIHNKHALPRPTPAKLLLFLLLLSLPSAVVSENRDYYLFELLFASLVQLINLGNIWLIVHSAPTKLLRIFSASSALNQTGPSDSIHLDRFALVAAGWVFTVCALFSILSYERHPHVTDEVAYLWHARMIAEGRFTLPPPPVPPAFEMNLLDLRNGIWYPAPPAGWPAVLALGVWVGAAWLVNALLGALNILLLYLISGRLYDRRIARMSILLLCVSPWFLFMGMNYMTHMTTLAFTLLAAWGIIKAREKNSVAWAFLAGSSAGFVSLIRPIDGLLVGLLCGGWALGVGGKRIRITGLALFAAGAVLVGSLVFPYNNYITGDPKIYPINAFNDARFGKNANLIGFGPDRGMGWGLDPNRGHDPFDAMINANLNTASMNFELFGWSTGSLLFLWIYLLAAKFHRSDLLMFAVVAAVFTAYFFYYFSGGPDFGARYWFIMIVPLVLLTARGILMAGERFSFAAVVLSLFALASFVPWRAVDKYHHYLNMRPDIRKLAKQHNFGRSLVLIQGDNHPDYASAFIYNPLDLKSDEPIYAWDRNAEVRRQLIAFYSDRAVWIVAGPTVTGGGYKIVQRPLSSQSLLAR